MRSEASFRAKRAYIATGTLISGFLMAGFFFSHLGLAPPLAILAILLAAAVGTGKLASP